MVFLQITIQQSGTILIVEPKHSNVTHFMTLFLAVHMTFFASGSLVLQIRRSGVQKIYKKWELFFVDARCMLAGFFAVNHVTDIRLV